MQSNRANWRRVGGRAFCAIVGAVRPRPSPNAGFTPSSCRASATSQAARADMPKHDHPLPAGMSLGDVSEPCDRGIRSQLLLFPGQVPGRNDINSRAHRSTEDKMLYWALMFLIIALIAGFLGFGGIAFAAAGIAKILFFIFLVVFVVMLITGLMGRRSPPI